MVPSGLVTAAVGAIDLTFAGSMDAASFTAATVLLSGPNGPITITGAQIVNASTVRISLPVQATTGLYSLSILPDVSDLAGNLLDQDGDGQPGEPDEDVFTGSFSISVADLVAVSVTGPTTARPGDAVSVSWTVRNDGDVASGSWVDRLYLSTNGQVAGATLLVSAPRTGLAPGVSYTRQFTVNLPTIADGSYRLLLVVDAGNAVLEGAGEANNTLASDVDVVVGHVDLKPTITTAPASAFSGAAIDVAWNTANLGTIATAGGWVERVYLSADNVVSGNDRLLAEITQGGPLGTAQGINTQRTLTLPADVTGTLFLLVVTDAANAITEPGGESNNVAFQSIRVDLTPWADLTVTSVDAPAQLIGDPAPLTVSWTVANIGPGAGLTTTWTDAVIASTNGVLGDGDDRVLARFTHSGGLAPGESDPRTETFLLPPAYTGRLHLFVVTDADGAVFENGLDANNALESPQLLDVMPIPYADLAVSSVVVPAQASSGQPLDITWTVANQGIGVTSVGEWVDAVALATDPQGQNRVVDFGTFSHFGQIAAGTSYDRTGQVRVPDGLTGTFYVVVKAGRKFDTNAGGPFEFVHDDNNIGVSAAFPIVLSPPPDLAVTEVVAPPSAVEGSLIDVSWTVVNQGTGDAEGTWTDVVYLQRAGNPAAPKVELGRFTYDEPVPSGISYVRSEAVRLPSQINDLYRVFVTANFEGTLYEHGATANNTRGATTEITVGVQPRPDLQIEEVVAPAQIDAGGTLNVEFLVRNQGTVATSTPQWFDRVYLSLDDKVTVDDILIEEVRNQSALAPGESYRTVTRSIVVPKRFRNEVHILVVADARGQVEEWPNDQNNLFDHPLFVVPAPLPDLVTGEVVAPLQAVDGSTIEVRYTVTNLGKGATDVADWIDTIWLARDKNRPHPSQGDVLLATVAHTGALAPGAGYDQVAQVTLPTNLDSGTYYLIPWSDPYDVVLEDTLAVNTNPDDPNEFDNNNYKARAIDIIGALPDLVVTSVVAPAQAKGGTAFHVSWTVENTGTGQARPGGWIDRVYLSPVPDPRPQEIKDLILAEVRRTDPLAPGQRYTASIDITLSPSAVGQYVVVVTDDKGAGAFPDYVVREVTEANNLRASASLVTPVPADLVVTNVVIPAVNYSGEKTTIRYTVTNVGQNPVWAGTQYWKDFIWISADPSFIRTRASYLGETIYAPDHPIQPGESYDVTFEATLPRGTRGDYYLYIHHDAHNDYNPFLFPYLARVLLTDWWPADSGSNASWIDHFSRWAFEDPTNNLSITPMEVTYREPDLEFTRLEVPAGATSGQSIEVPFTVTNTGTRATRTSAWVDRLFLSLDPSLDAGDLYLDTVSRSGAVGIGESYDGTFHARLPDGIEGTFYLLAFADAAAELDIFGQSTIGFNLLGVKFQSGNILAPWDLASVNERIIAQGAVGEYQDEGNNIVATALPVTLADPPDLRVTAIVAPARDPRPVDRPHLHRHQPRRRHALDAGPVGRPDLLLARPQSRPESRPLSGRPDAARPASAPGRTTRSTRA